MDVKNIAGTSFTYGSTILDIKSKKIIEKRKHPANTALPSDPISLNLVPT